MFNHFFVADCHVHGSAPDGSLWQWSPSLKNEEEAHRYLGRAGIDLAIQNSYFAVKAKSAADLNAGNTHALKWARLKKKKGVPRILPAAILHPRFIQAAEKTLDQFRKAGSCWVGEICPYVAGYAPSHPNFIRLAKLIEERNFVLQLHSSSDLGLEKLAEVCPNLCLVSSHLGAKRSEIQASFELAKKIPTLYLDICGNGHERVGILERGVLEFGLEDRLLYGSDFSINEPGGPLTRIVNSTLSDKVKKKILSGNLLRILGEHGVKG